MGRLLALALAVAAAGVAVVVVNGPGIDKPKEPESTQATREAATTSGSGPDGKVAPAGAPDPARAKVGATVRMKDLRFVPQEVSVDVGEAVRFVNDDDVAHTVFQDVGARSGIAPLIDTRRIQPGESVTFTARRRGLITYVCTLHPSVMRGQILVEPPAL